MCCFCSRRYREILALPIETRKWGASGLKVQIGYRFDSKYINILISSWYSYIIQYPHLCPIFQYSPNIVQYLSLWLIPLSDSSIFVQYSPLVNPGFLAWIFPRTSFRLPVANPTNHLLQSRLTAFAISSYRFNHDTIALIKITSAASSFWVIWKDPFWPWQQQRYIKIPWNIVVRVSYDLRSVHEYSILARLCEVEFS